MQPDSHPPPHSSVLGRGFEVKPLTARAFARTESRWRRAPAGARRAAVRRAARAHAGPGWLPSEGCAWPQLGLGTTRAIAVAARAGTARARARARARDD